MQVQRIQDNQTSFQALKGVECGKNLKPILGNAGEAIEEKLVKAFNKNEYFLELCRRNDVWVNVKPLYTDYIRSGLEVEITAGKLDAPKSVRRERVISHHEVKLYEPYDYKRNYDYSELEKKNRRLEIYNLIEDFNSRADEIVRRFINNYRLSQAIRNFFEKSANNS